MVEMGSKNNLGSTCLSDRLVTRFSVPTQPPETRLTQVVLARPRSRYETVELSAWLCNTCYPILATGHAAMPTVAQNRTDLQKF